MEAKVRVYNPEKMREKLALNGKYIGKIDKIDDYYSLERQAYPKKSLRIRRRKGFYEINFKRRISYKYGVHAKKEVEFKASNIKDFIALIEDFGFKKWLRKEKRCEVYNMGKNLSAELNYVERLGWFLEIEYLAEESRKNIEKAREEVLRAMKMLDIKKKDIVKEGYTKLLWDKNHIIR